MIRGAETLRKIKYGDFSKCPGDFHCEKRNFFSAVGDVPVCPQRAAGEPRDHPVSKRSQAVGLPKQPPPAVPEGVETRSAPRMRNTADPTLAELEK